MEPPDFFATNTAAGSSILDLGKFCSTQKIVHLFK